MLVPSYWYYQNNHLLVIPRLSEEVLDYLQLFVNNSQYVADSVDWSVILGFQKKSFFELDFQSSIYRPNKTLSGQALFSVLTMRKRKMSPNPISHGKGLSFFALFAIRVKCTYYLESIFFACLQYVLYTILYAFQARYSA